jgi:hypothetical protein
VKKTSVLLLLLLLMIGGLAVTEPTPASGLPSEPTEEIYLGLGEATPGENGWIVSDYTIRIISPVDALVNGQPLKDGRFTITGDGRHSVELQPGPNGQGNTVTQFINIDKTPPKVEWTTEHNAAMSGWDALTAELSDETAGLCSVESSFDHGQNWDSHNLAPMTPDGVTILHETTWSIHRDFRDFPPGVQVVLLRARDCAGNVSPGEILVFRVVKP